MPVSIEANIALLGLLVAVFNLAYTISKDIHKKK